ncbi:MAG: hypothetical protein WC626_05405 [Methanoregula sp.]
MTKSDVEYSEEQLADIQARIVADREREHRAIAGDQAYRLAIFHVANEVQRGLYDPELLKVLGELWEQFRKGNPILGKQKEAPKPAEG